MASAASDAFARALSIASLTAPATCSLASAAASAPSRVASPTALARSPAGSAAAFAARSAASRAALVASAMLRSVSVMVPPFVVRCGHRTLGALSTAERVSGVANVAKRVLPRVVLSAIGMFLLVFGIQEGETYDWGTIVGPITVWGLIITGVVVLVGFVVWQRFNPADPLL